MSEDSPLGRLLVIDDEPDVREVLMESLEAAGYVTAPASNGREALTLLRQQSFDLVLSDIVMPDMDGIQLLRELRKRDLDVPMILITGSPTFDTAVRALEYGALRYLVKPVSLDVLLETVDKAIRLHRLAHVKREALAHLRAEDKLLGDRASLEGAFDRAMETFWMAYQPIVRAQDGTVEAHEALLRSDEPTLPNPLVVIQAAERLERVHLLGRAIRRRVAVTLRSGSKVEQAFVNLHPQDLLDEDLFASDAPLSPLAARVVLEVTERASLDGLPDVPDRIRALRALGYRIALDDLGAGYAGLTSFARLEPQIVKIDMGLVRGVDREPIKRRLVGSIASLCRGLNMRVVAEGVETEDERQVVVELGCDLLQGYLFGRPLRLDP